MSDSQGTFKLSVPPLGQALAREVNLMAYRPFGLAIGFVGVAQRPYRIVLRAPKPRTVMVVGADGKPVSGGQDRLKAALRFRGNWGGGFRGARRNDRDKHRT